MNRLIVALLSVLVITGCGSPSPAAILVFNPNGTYSLPQTQTLSAAATDPANAGKTIVVTTALTAIQSNISSATVHSWPSDRTLDVKTGGSINPTTKFTGLKEARPEWFGALPDGSTDCAPGMTKAIIAVAGGGTLRLSAGTYLLDSIQEGTYYLVKSKSGASVIGEGASSIIRVGDGIRTTSTGVAVLYNHTEPISDVTYSNFTVDFNGANNLFVTGYGISANVNRMGASAGGSNINVSGMTFKNAGGHHSLWFDGGFTNVNITNNIFSECGQSIAGNEVTDHSSIYADSNGLVITNNQFTNSGQDEVATAIEIHGGNITCAGNTIAKYSHGINVAGDQETSSGITITGNVMNFVTRGVVIWAQSAYTVNDLVISGNRISVYDNEEAGVYPPGGGILSVGYDTSTETSSNWTISDNVITAANHYTGAFAWQIVGINPSPINGLIIKGNNISGLKGEGIRLEGASGKYHNGVLIDNNIVSSCGFTSAAGRNNGVFLASLNTVGVTTDLTVSSNTIIAGHFGTADDMDYGIKFNGQQFSNVMVSGNNITGAVTGDIYTSGTAQTTGVFDINHRSKTAGSPIDQVIVSTVGGVWYDSVAKRLYNAIYTGPSGSEVVWRSTEYLLAAPAGGKHYTGDRWIQASPSVGNPKGGYCTVTGTPGTWVNDANL